MFYTVGFNLLVQLLVCKIIGHQRSRPYGGYSPFSLGCWCPADFPQRQYYWTVFPAERASDFLP